MPDAGDVHLANRYRGLVEVFLSTQWVAVAKSIPWTLENAQVVCRELGYDFNGDPPTMIYGFWLIMLFFNRHNIAWRYNILSLQCIRADGQCCVYWN